VDDAPVLPLEDFAAIAARIDAGVPRDRALEEAGVTLAAWSAAQTAWLERMAARSAAGRYTLSARYAELFARHRRLAGIKRYEDRVPLEGQVPEAPVEVAPPVIVMDRLVAGFGAPRSPVASSPGSPTPFPGGPSSPGQPAHGPAGMSAPQAPSTTLGVHDFATLRAELAVAPEAEHVAIQARYGLDARAWAREELGWHARLTADEALQRQFIAHFRYMRSMFESSSRPR
jgi:hypothetical protein